MTDPCAAFDADLSALLDGALARPREAELRAHVAGCARCSERLARLARVDEALRSLPAGEVPADLAGRLRARIAAEGRGRSSASRGPSPSRRTPSRRRRWIPLAAGAIAAAAALALYLVVSRPRTAKEEPTLAEGEKPVLESEIAKRESVPEPSPAELEAIQAASDEELALALDLDTLADLDVIERLDVLEQLAALDGAG